MAVAGLQWSTSDLDSNTGMYWRLSV